MDDPGFDGALSHHLHASQTSSINPSLLSHGRQSPPQNGVDGSRNIAVAQTLSHVPNIPCPMTAAKSQPQAECNANNDHQPSLRRRRCQRPGNKALKKQAAALKRASKPPSKAALKRAEIEIIYGPGMVGSDDELKGETRILDDGSLEWHDLRTGCWLPAAPHDSFRQDFIDMSTGEAAFVQKPDRGLLSLDVTSNCSFLGQNEWIFHSQGLKDIMDSEGNRVMHLDRQPPRYHEYPEGRYWIHKGLVMLDPDDRPVLKYPGLPLVISSQIEGSRMEAFKRVFPWLRNSDLRARMPRMVMKRAGLLEPLAKYSTFGQRMTRFRMKHGLAAWRDRPGAGGHGKRSIRDISGDYSDTDGDASHESPRTKTRYQVKPEHDFEYIGLEDASFLQRSPLVLNKEDLGQQGMVAFTPTLHDTLSQQSAIMAQPEPSAHFQSAEDDVRSTAPLNPDGTPNFWFQEPLTTKEHQTLQAALEITRADYRSYHGFEPPPTKPQEAYIYQFNSIEEFHNERWLVDDSPPSLLGVTSWEGSFDNWQVWSWAEEAIRQRLNSEYDTGQNNDDTPVADCSGYMDDQKDLMAWSGNDALGAAEG